jgi:RNA polymerase sigma-70 factor (ECF subfamily)
MEQLIQTRQSLLGRLKDWDDDKSWRDFFDTYWRIIYSYGRKAGLSESEAEEVVQDTVLSVAKEMRRFKYDPAAGSFKGYLKQLTRRRIVDKFRQRPKMEEQLSSDETGGSGVSPLEGLPDVAAEEQADAVWENEWRQNLVERALEIVGTQISSRQYQVFDLYVVRQMSVRDVARTMGINIAQVYLAKSRVSVLVAKELRRLEKTLF